MKTRTLFLIDGIGALLSATTLFLISRYFQEYIGMPSAALSILTMIAVVFSLYSFTCYFLVNKYRKRYLSVISTANILYCCLTLGFVIVHYQQVTTLGVLYFLLETAVIVALVYVEIKAIRRTTEDEYPSPAGQ